jgi:hypothetical protein
MAEQCTLQKGARAGGAAEPGRMGHVFHCGGTYTLLPMNTAGHGAFMRVPRICEKVFPTSLIVVKHTLQFIVLMFYYIFISIY